MSFLFSSPISREIDKLTDENIPGHQLNLGDALDFADKVRSKEYVPREVARLLKGRLAHQNPNVQLMALQLTDVIIKNGGDRFLVEISSRDFVQNLVGIIRHSVYSYELYSESLKYLQEWAVLCQGNAELAAIYNAYSQLKREGFPFPKTASVSKAMIETHTAPEWTDSSVCMRCRTPFTLTNRKHHCRHCGNCFCQSCSENSLPIPKFAIYEPVRVCHGCYLRLKKVIPDGPPGIGPGSRQPTRASAVVWSSPAGSAESLVPPKSKDEEDEELRRAIELSLKETQRHSASHPTYQQRQGQQSAPGEPYPLPLQEDGEYEPDREMRAAIEASLREMRISGPQAPEQFPVTEEAYHQGVVEGEERVHQQMNHFMPGADAPSSSSLSPSANEISDDNPLTSIEQENVSLFEDLLQRIKESGQNISNDSQIQYLHESISDLQPRVDEAIARVNSKHHQLTQFLNRIGTAAKIYDQLLEQRLSLKYSGTGATTSRQRSVREHQHTPPRHDIQATPQPYAQTQLQPSAHLAQVPNPPPSDHYNDSNNSNSGGYSYPLPRQAASPFNFGAGHPIAAVTTEPAYQQQGHPPQSMDAGYPYQYYPQQHQPAHAGGHQRPPNPQQQPHYPPSGNIPGPVAIPEAPTDAYLQGQPGTNQQPQPGVYPLPDASTRIALPTTAVAQHSVLPSIPPLMPASKRPEQPNPAEPASSGNGSRSNNNTTAGQEEQLLIEL